MMTPVIDAEAVKEFLDKAEPFLTSDMLHRWDVTLLARQQKLTEILFKPSLNSNARIKSLSALVASTARLSEDALIPWMPVMQRVLDLTIDDVQAVVPYIGRLDSAPGWLWEWATFWGFAIDPVQHPWWSRWLYSPDSRTGSMALVMMDPEQLSSTADELYQQLSMGVTFYVSVLESTRRFNVVSDRFRGWIGLACTYAVYMFTMASWRLTTEFTQVMPPFPKVVQSLLGIHRWEGSVLAKG
ncbi:MAG: hypothetical protein ACYCOU_09355 [Sulfobacillus sp.]